MACLFFWMYLLHLVLKMTQERQRINFCSLSYGYGYIWYVPHKLLIYLFAQKINASFKSQCLSYMGNFGKEDNIDKNVSEIKNFIQNLFWLKYRKLFLFSKVYVIFFFTQKCFMDFLKLKLNINWLSYVLHKIFTIEKMMFSFAKSFCCW